MKQKSLLTLVILATLALVAAWMISERRAPTQDVTTTPLFPNLIDQVNSVSHIDVRNAQHHSELELETPPKPGNRLQTGNSMDSTATYKHFRSSFTPESSN